MIRHITGKIENIWSSRGILYQMMQKTGEPVRSFAARLYGQARLCRYRTTCEANGCTQSNDFTDIIIMGELICGLADQETKELVLSKITEIEDLTALITLVKTKELEEHSSDTLGNVNSRSKPEKMPQCCYCRTNHPSLKG